MNIIEPSVHQFLQGELDVDELTLKLEKIAAESPEDTKAILEQITQLSRKGKISAVDQSKLENIFKRIKALRGETVLWSTAEDLFPEPDVGNPFVPLQRRTDAGEWNTPLIR